MSKQSSLLDLGDQSMWLRGVTPENIKEQCYQLCGQYLADFWLKVSIDQIKVNRISGGLTNQLYLCAIDPTIDTIDAKEPTKVAIRLYGDKHFNNEELNQRLSDVIISLLVSENNLEPKIYGLFEKGQIMSYHKHRNFREEEQNNPILVDKLAKMLARVHAMDVPIKRTGNWIFNFFDKSYEMANERFDIKKLIEESDCQTFKTFDIKTEINWIKETLHSLDSPITFTHVDFRGSNIMVTEPDDQLVLCDFEYSAYGYRGVDFGTIFAEWNGRIWTDVHKLHDFPEDKTIIPFIESYIEESVKLNGKQFLTDKRNSIENILKEVKIFTLVSNMFFIVLSLRTNESLRNPDKPFDKRSSMVFCDLNYKNYHHLKQMFRRQQVI